MSLFDTCLLSKQTLLSLPPMIYINNLEITVEGRACEPSRCTEILGRHSPLQPAGSPSTSNYGPGEFFNGTEISIENDNVYESTNLYRIQIQGLPTI